ncbi:ATPase family protein associated with various cellular activities (AAA) [Tahibacter aquaticus]|uniref:ATPase family protein associated with various cellular activities (AAA) n=1 Tax=Tahibacter aquaticus TaxID=520092 RepID=A0A4R6Z4P2_9GAMM|nr:DNA repair ATPase [Tahibacter aquaticus]TDR46621.1 ATPase family protein associated with various cellular activities (AAA) [Tahibacter aquaticus]
MSDSATFELLRKRLIAAAQALQSKTTALNTRRVEAFGRVESKLLARLNARTEHNCVARDIVRVGDVLLFGYNVFIGLKKETTVADVFCLYALNDGGEAPELAPLPIAGSFLDDARFAADFRELFTYYRATTLDQLRVLDERLLLVFRTGTQTGDKRVFRFAIERDGRISYIDNRGERDHILPPSHDFEWVPVTRDQFVLGRHPHVNVLDSVFVETVAGDLTIKVENNTETGLGIYSEPVEDKNQSLADAEIAYADLRSMILLRVKPYREDAQRYLVFNKRLRTVVRIDEIGASCLQLPEDHGLVFPGGYYLESGDYKRFADLGHDFSAYRIKRHLRAPSGEDMLYVFYEPASGSYALLSYNLIERSMSQPLLGNGYARFVDGRILLVTPEAQEQASRLHTMQLWRTPFTFDEYASAQPRVPGLLGRLGNASVVRALAELRELARLAEDTGSRGAYERLLRVAARCSDAYPWLAEAEAGEIGSEVSLLARSGREALNAYEKLERAQNDAAQQLKAAEKATGELLSRVAGLLWQKPDDFTDAIRLLKRKRGELTVLGEQPHMPAAGIAALDQRLREELDRIGTRALKFFAEPAAFASLRQGLADSAGAVEQARTTAALAPVAEKLDALAESLDGLSALIAGFEQSDAQQRATLLGETSQLYAEVNRIRASLRTRRDALLVQEQGLEFGAQLTVLEQSVLNLLGRCDTPESADAALAQVLSQIEQLEARFGEQPDFLVELTSRREGALEAFAARREQIAGQRDKRAQGLKEAIGRVLDGVPRRVAKIAAAEELHAFFAGDSLVERAQRQIGELRGLGQSVAADELAGRLKALKEAGLRDLRDRNELGASGEALALGKHRFTIERSTLDLALMHDADGLSLQLTGTDYRRRLDEPRAEPYRQVWGQPLPNEDAQVYRAEFLAAQLWQRIQSGDALLHEAVRASDPQVLLDAIAQEAQRRPGEDYQRGVHDADAAAILRELVRLGEAAGELRLPAQARVLAQAWYAIQREQGQALVRAHAAGLHWFLQQREAAPLPPSWLSGLQAAAPQFCLDAGAANAAAAARHLVASLGGDKAQFAASAAALDLAQRAAAELPRTALAALQSELPAGERLNLAREWCLRLAAGEAALALEAGAILAFAELPRERINAQLGADIGGLRGVHARLRDGQLRLELPEFIARLQRYTESTEKDWHAFATLRHGIVTAERERLALDRFLAKPMAGFVRNRLIDEVYLPLIGNNLAKQIGSVGDARSDRSGLLLLISPPGYGKTTLMEYVADRLGMVFVRVNGPTLGHEVNSLDPAAVSQRGAAEELIKLNLGLAMGVNVMLYLDDIQHLSAEFLQKFISLADGTRRIDAIVDGQARTLDLRGKRFALVMAGNPYTESGEVFRIPDMLANRADVYNLGDVLSGREALFADSYIENALTAHPLSAALAERPRSEIQAVLRAARGDEAEVPAQLPGGVETLELIRRMVGVRDVLMRVNAAYVASAAQDDAYRSEPAFKLQGSYRNMAKLSAQLSPLLTAAELDALIRDHYRGEAQTLGARAEENLLRLAQLIGAPSADEQQRWDVLAENFRRLAKQGGKDADGATRMAQMLAEIALQLEKQGTQTQGLGTALVALDKLADIHTALQRDARLEAPPALSDALARMAKAYEETLLPLVSALHHKMTLDHDMWEQVRQVRTSLDGLVKRSGKT